MVICEAGITRGEKVLSVTIIIYYCYYHCESDAFKLLFGTNFNSKK